MTRKFMGEAPLMEKKSFIKEGENVLANYDWTDLIQGVGYINFFAVEIGTSISNSAAANEWRQELIRDPSLFTPLKRTSAQGSSTSATYETIVDLNFDLAPFAIAKTLGGTAYVNSWFGIRSTSASGGTGSTAKRTVSIINQTKGITIGTFTKERTNTGGDLRTMMFLDPISISPVMVGVGDVLRLNYKVELKRDVGTGTPSAGTVFDPFNQEVVVPADLSTTVTPEDYTTSTQMILALPFKIEI
jgi:hypothetical protein